VLRESYFEIVTCIIFAVNLCAHFNEKLLAKDYLPDVENTEKYVKLNMLFFLVN